MPSFFDARYPPVNKPSYKCGQPPDTRETHMNSWALARALAISSRGEFPFTSSFLLVARLNPFLPLNPIEIPFTPIEISVCEITLKSR